MTILKSVSFVGSDALAVLRLTGNSYGDAGAMQVQLGDGDGGGTFAYVTEDEALEISRAWLKVRNEIAVERATAAEIVIDHQRHPQNLHQFAVGENAVTL